MESDGFVLVESKRSSKRRTAKMNRTECSVSEISVALEQARQMVMNSQMGEWVERQLTRFTDGRPLTRILLVGNGHFDDKWEAGAHQLTLVMQIYEAFGHPEIVFQEPCLSPSEREWLTTSLENCTMRDSDDLLIPCAGPGFELVVVIHGVHSLLNDYLWQNWSVESLRKTMFIANDYGNGLTGMSEANQKSYQALQAFSSLCRSVPLPTYCHHPLIFHDTSLLYLPSDKVLPDISPARPVYEPQVG